MCFRQMLVLDRLYGRSRALSGAVLLAEAQHARVRLLALPLSWGGRRTPRCANGEVAAAERLEHRAVPLRARGIDVTTAVLLGDPREAIAAEAARWGADLIVKSCDPRRPIRDLFRQSDDRRLLRTSPCPVWLVPESDATGFGGPVLAAVNPPDRETSGAPLNEYVLGAAHAVGRALRVQLHVVHAWSASLMPAVGAAAALAPHDGTASTRADFEAASARLERCIARAEVRVHRKNVHLVRGDPRGVLPELASAIRADVLVAGTAARGGLFGLIAGNVAEQILPDLDECSLLVVGREERSAVLAPPPAPSWFRAAGP